MSSDIARLRSLRSALEEIERPGVGLADDQAIAGTKSDIRMIENEWPDERLFDAFEATGGEPGDAEADAFLAEIKRRGLDL